MFWFGPPVAVRVGSALLELIGNPANLLTALGSRPSSFSSNCTCDQGFQDLTYTRGLP